MRNKSINQEEEARKNSMNIFRKIVKKILIHGYKLLLTKKCKAIMNKYIGMNHKKRGRIRRTQKSRSKRSKENKTITHFKI